MNLNDYFKTKFSCLIFISWIFLSCTSDTSTEIKLDYTINSIDIVNNQMDVTFTITNSTKVDLDEQNWSLHWNQILGSPVQGSLPDGIDFEWVNGNSYFIFYFGKKWSVLAGERISFNVKTSGVVSRLDFGPKGAFVVCGGKTIDVKNTIHWENAKGLAQLNLPTAKSRFEKLKNIKSLKPERIDWVLPRPLSYIKHNGQRPRLETWRVFDEDYFQKSSEFSAVDLFEKMVKDRFSAVHIEWTDSKSKSNIIISSEKTLSNEAYKLNIDSDKIVIKHNSYAGLLYALQSLYQIDQVSLIEQIDWPIVEINDQPRFAYRGFMLDISRHYFGLEKLKQIIDVMSLLKLNQFDLKLADDEGWRLEIPELAELTEIGSNRGYTNDEKDRLIPMYGSGAQGNAWGNGFLSKTDFIELLQYAQFRNVNIIPNISFSSHARAAIVSMDVRRDRFMADGQIDKANEFALSDLKDKSQYASAQLYNDNTINICMESSLAFFDKVIAEVADMYHQAKVPFKQFNIGADELPFGVWEGSPVCANIIGEGQRGKSLDEIYNQTLSFLRDRIESRGAIMGGWEDFLLIHSKNSQSETVMKEEKFNYNVVPYSWNNIWGGGREDMVYKFANAGFKTVMSNSSAFYFDMANDNDMDSHGLSWSGYVDYFDMWAIEPLDIFANSYLNKKHNISEDYISKTTRLKENKRKNLIGIQSQLWSETITSEEILDEMLFPNLIIFAEKAWAQKPSWLSVKNDFQEAQMMEDWNEFVNLLGHHTLGLIASEFPEIKYDITKPGAIIRRDSLYVRTEFPGLKVHYTTDGSVPTIKSKQYTKPVSVESGSEVVLRAFGFNSRGGKSIKITP